MTVVDRQMIRGVTLDVGQTLLFARPSLGEIYCRVAGEHGIEVTAEWAESAFQRAWRLTQARQNGLIYGRTHAEAVDFWRRVIALMFADAAPAGPVLDGFVEALYDVFAHAPAWRINAGLEPLLEACERGGIRVAILSNWDQRLRGLLDELGLSHRVDPLVISAEHGLEKPDPAIFEVALAGLGLPAEQVLHVGDTWEDDIVGARAAGLRAAWYNPGAIARPDSSDGIIELQELTDLLPHLAG